MTLVGVLKILLSRDDDEVEQTLQNFFSKMFNIGRAVCFILAIIFTIIAVITNSQNSSRRVPPTKPFFNRNTWVEDFYEGELYYALLKATKYDVIFLMLYAPWDADSQNARSEFETACRYFHKKVYCAAVNCWQSNAGCKAFFDNIAMYPLFLVDLHHVPSIKYNGEYVASHMIRFLSTVIKPLERVNSVDSFHTLANSCDAMVVAFLPDYKWYLRYYTASLKYLEYDPRRDVCWSIVTDGSLAGSLKLERFSMKLYTWNETKRYVDPFVNKNIVKWVHENAKFLTRWLFFKNARNYILSDLLEHNPAVILFTPHNVFLDYNPSYLMFKEVALQFKNCFTNVSAEYRRVFISNLRKKIIDDDYCERVCKSRFSFVNPNRNSDILSLIGGNYEKYVFSSVNVSNSTLSYFRTNDASRKATLGEAAASSMLDPSKDHRSPQNLVLSHVREKCRRCNLSKKTYNYSYFSDPVQDEASDELLGSLCRVNSTLTFFAVDSLLYSHFASALGINLNGYKDHTTVVIFNNQDEESFVLSDKFNSKNAFYEFLINFANHTAPRWLKSTADASIYTNHYNKSNNPIPDEITITELSVETFKPVVFNPTQHVVVFFYTPYCTYCQVLANIFLSVAHTLRNFSHIMFARIDGENNDLPWHLVPQSYPSIILFPTNRKSESVVFPQSQEMNTKNLLEFVLSNVDVGVRLKVMADECNKYRHIEQKIACVVFEKCVTNVKTYCLRLINNLVEKYKKSYLNVSTSVNVASTMQTMLSRLKYLKSIYFSLENL